jgi:uncharacterized protein YcnI
VRVLRATLLAALVLPACAVAHVTIDPPFVNDGVASKIAFKAPNERSPHATIELRTTAPPGIRIVSAAAPAGWHAVVDGSTATWTGGRIKGTAIVAFTVRVLAKVRAGTYSFLSAQRYDDGATVKWKASLSVLPAKGGAAPKEHPWGAIAAALAGVLVIGASLVGIRLLRRRTLQDR